MKSRFRFQPASLDSLEARLVLSTAGLGHLAPQVVHIDAMRRMPSMVSPAVATFETQWMKGMIDHHGSGIQMAKIALKNSANKEVKALAQDIIRSQSHQITRMQRWLSSWYKIEGVRPTMMAGDHHMLNDLKMGNLATFDQRFLTTMIEHHTTAIADAKDLVNNGAHKPLLQLGANIIGQQSGEIAQMQHLLTQVGGTMHMPSGSGMRM